MKNPIRFLIGSLAVLSLLVALGAWAQSASQTIAFSVLGEYQTTTNSATDPSVTNYDIHMILFTSANVAKAIAVDQFGKPAWTNWSHAKLLRRVNLVTGQEAIYLSKGGPNEVDVSSYFTTSYVSNFTSGVAAAFPVAANNFDTNNPSPLETLYFGSSTNIHSSAGMQFISVTTTNLKMNLIGSSFGGAGTGQGIINKFSGVIDGINYSGELQNNAVSVVGTFSWTPNTNIFNIGTNINTFYSGPAHGTVVFRKPAFSKLASPPSNPE